MSGDKIEAVSKVSAALEKQNVSDLERVAPDREHFEHLLSTPSTSKPSFERVDAQVPSQIEGLENNPVFTEDRTSAQGSGTATDQERKRKREPEVGEIEEVSSNKRAISESSSSSLMDEVKKLDSEVASVSHMSKEKLRSQTEGIIAQIDDVKAQLASSKSEIRPAYNTILNNHLNHIDDNLKIAMSKAGVEYTPPPTAGTGKNPIEHFLGYLTHTQYQLQNLDATIGNLGMKNGAEISPASMLTLQIKMSYVSQQMELFTSLLNKALESTKTIMNVQI